LIKSRRSIVFDSIPELRHRSGETKGVAHNPHTQMESEPIVAKADSNRKGDCASIQKQKRHGFPSAAFGRNQTKSKPQRTQRKTKL